MLRWPAAYGNSYAENTTPQFQARSSKFYPNITHTWLTWSMSCLFIGLLCSSLAGLSFLIFLPVMMPMLLCYLIFFLPQFTRLIFQKKNSYPVEMCTLYLLVLWGFVTTLQHVHWQNSNIKKVVAWMSKGSAQLRFCSTKYSKISVIRFGENNWL